MAFASSPKVALKFQDDVPKTKRPVLLVGPFLSFSLGIRGFCEDLSAELAKSGWPVMTTSNKKSRLLRVLDMISTIWTKRRDYEVATVDVYSGNGFMWAELVCQIFRWINKPFILALHGGNLPAFAKRWPKRVQRLLGSGNAVTAPSRYLYKQMSRYRRDIHLLPNPVNLSHYTFVLRDAPQPILLWLRAFHSVYNPSLAPKVLAHLKREHPNASLIMIGPDKGDGSLDETRRVAIKLGVVNSLKFPGKIDKTEVPKWLSMGDIFLNTSNIDNTPVSVLEAMACGLCVVSTDVGGIPYLLEHERDALLAPPNDPAAMAAAVHRLLTERDLAGKISENAHKKVAAFDWSIVLPKWEKLLASAGRKGKSL